MTEIIYGSDLKDTTNTTNSLFLRRIETRSSWEVDNFDILSSDTPEILFMFCFLYRIVKEVSTCTDKWIYDIAYVCVYVCVYVRL